jgi:hypothetical protein
MWLLYVPWAYSQYNSCVPRTGTLRKREQSHTEVEDVFCNLRSHHITFTTLLLGAVTNLPDSRREINSTF